MLGGFSDIWFHTILLNKHVRSWAMLAAVCTVGRPLCSIASDSVATYNGNEPGTGLPCRSPELRPHPLWSTNSVRHKCSAAAMSTRSTARCLCRQSLRRTRASASR